MKEKNRRTMNWLVFLYALGFLLIGVAILGMVYKGYYSGGWMWLNILFGILFIGIAIYTWVTANKFETLERAASLRA